MMTSNALKREIKSLHDEALRLTNELAVAEYRAESLAFEAKIQRKYCEDRKQKLNSIKSKGRELCFLLLVSISHRGFIKFIKGLENGTL